MCVARVFFFARIPYFYANYLSLYTKVYVLLFKWPTFYSKFLVRVLTCGHRPVCPPCVRILLWARSALRESNGRGEFKWVIWRRCAQNNLSARYLLRQSQYWTRIPVRLPGLQSSWYPNSTQHPGVWPCDYNWDPDINPTFNVWNGFIHFCGHESTQIGK